MGKAALIALPAICITDFISQTTPYGRWWRRFKARVHNWASHSKSITGEKAQQIIADIVRHRNIDVSLLEKPVSEYKTVSELLSARHKPRNIPLDENAIFAPCDSLLMSLERVTGDAVTVTKNRQYMLGELIKGPRKHLGEESINRLKHDPENDMYSAVFYVREVDYAHVHAPTRFNLSRYTYIKGDFADYLNIWKNYRDVA